MPSWSTLINVILPPDKGIFVPFLIPLACGLAISGKTELETFIGILVAWILLFIRSILISEMRKQNREGLDLRIFLQPSLLFLITIAIVAGIFLISVHHLILLIPIGSLVAFSLLLNVHQFPTGRNKNALSQFLSVFSISSSAFVIPYLTLGRITVGSVVAWFILTAGFATSIMNMRVKNLLLIHAGEISFRERILSGPPSLFSNIGLWIISFLLYDTGLLPLNSFLSTNGLIFSSIIVVYLFPISWIDRYRDQSELFLLAVWGMGMAVGFFLG